LIQFLSRNNLKPENPRGNQADKYDLSRVVIAFGKGCQEIKNVQSQLLFLLGVLPDIYRIMVAERKRVDRLAQDPARTKASPFRPTATKGRRTGLH